MANVQQRDGRSTFIVSLLSWSMGGFSWHLQGYLPLTRLATFLLGSIALHWRRFSPASVMGDVREHWGNVLQDVLALARSTRYLEAVYIFGSFVTAKATPADLALFLVMSDDFASNFVEEHTCLLFDRSRAAMVWGICIY